MYTAHARRSGFPSQRMLALLEHSRSDFGLSLRVVAKENRAIFGAYEILASHNTGDEGGTARPAENSVRIRALFVCPDTVLTELSHPSTLTVRMSVREEVVCR